MKEFLKRSGLIFVVAGIAVLAYAEFSKMENNTMLVVSGSLIVFGLLLYVILNNVID
jgi:predicted transporter